MKNGLGRRISLFLLPLICSWIIRIWFASCRKRIHGHHNRLSAENRRTAMIGTTWHYCVIGMFIFFQNESPVFMISASNDGDYLSRMAGNLGFSVVRGSRNSRGASAAKGLIKELRQGKIVGLVADGSQGPPRRVQPGSILLASKTGASILPVLWSASHHFSFNSWDRLILPLPFSRIDLFYGEPLLVPEELKAEGMEEYRLVLEKRLNDLYDTAWQVQGKKEH